jgi:hypothetical protein
MSEVCTSVRVTSMYKDQVLYRSIGVGERMSRVICLLITGCIITNTG